MTDRGPTDCLRALVLAAVVVLATAGPGLATGVVGPSTNADRGVASTGPDAVDGGDVPAAGAATASVASNNTTGTDWPMFRGNPEHTGHVDTTGPRDDVVQSWNFTAGGGIASPAVANGTVYVGSHDRTLYALNATTGAEVWNVTTGDDVETAPAVVGGVVYFGSNDDNVYAVDASTGAEVWNFTTSDFVQSSPTVVNGTVYVGDSDGTVYAIDASTGTELWSVTVDGSFPSVRSSPAVVNGTVYVGSGAGVGSGHVYALDASTGAEQWRYTTNYVVETAPTAVNGTVYAANFGAYVFALDASTGTETWNVSLGSGLTGQDSSPALVNGTLYVGSVNNDVYALNASTGSQEWRFPTSFSVDSSPAVVDGTVYVGSGEGTLYVIDAASGTELARYNTSGSMGSSPAVADGTVYVGNDNSRVFALTEPTAPPPSFAVSVGSTNSPVTEGETLTVDATVENTGGSEGTQTVTLSVDGTQRDSTTVTLAPGATTAVTLSWATSTGDAGSYTATVASANTSGTASLAVEQASSTGQRSPPAGGTSSGPTASVDAPVENGDVVVEPASEQTVAGSSSLSAGDRLTVTLRSSDSEVFPLAKTVAVDAGGGWEATFDLSGVQSGLSFLLLVSADGEILDSASGRVVAPASVEVSNQRTEGARTLYVDSVRLPSGGFAVVYRASDMAVLGTSTYLSPGLHNDVRVVLDQQLPDGSTDLLVLVHRNEGGAGFDRQEDPPYTVGGEPVSDAATATVPTPTTTKATTNPTTTRTPTSTPTPSTTTPTPTSTQASSTSASSTTTTAPTTEAVTTGGQPGFGTGVALLALALAAVLAVRRRR